MPLDNPDILTEYSCTNKGLYHLARTQVSV